MSGFLILLMTLVSSAEGAGYYFLDRALSRPAAVEPGRRCRQPVRAAPQPRRSHPRRCPKHQCRLEWRLAAQLLHALIGDDPEEFGPTIENQAGHFNVPQLGFATPINDKFAFAFGFVSPLAPDSDYPADGAQRYSIIDSSIYQFGFGPALAWRPLPAITFGVNMQWQFLQVGQQFMATLSGETDPLGDIGVDLFTVDVFTPYANFGVLIDPVPPVTIGIGVQPATVFRPKGRLSIDFTDNAFEDLIEAPDCGAENIEDCPTQFTDDDINLMVRLPLILKTGVAVRPFPELEIEAAFVYQNWKTLTDLTVTDIDLNLNVAVLGEQSVDNEPRARRELS